MVWHTHTYICACVRIRLSCDTIEQVFANHRAVQARFGGPCGCIASGQWRLKVAGTKLLLVPQPKAPRKHWKTNINTYDMCWCCPWTLPDNIQGERNNNSNNNNSSNLFNRANTTAMQCIVCLVNIGKGWLTPWCAHCIFARRIKMADEQLDPLPDLQCWVLENRFTVLQCDQKGFMFNKGLHISHIYQEHCIATNRKCVETSV